MNNNEKPYISVIIPVYRTEKYLRQCIESVINQSLEKLQIIIVDDGSDDNSGRIIDEYKSKDNRIIAIHKANGGLSSARNEGMKKATAKFITFADSDDALETHIYEKALAAADEKSIVLWQYSEFTENIPEVKNSRDNITTVQSREALTMLFRDEKIKNHVWNKLYPAWLFDDIQFPEGRKFEDIHVMYRLFEKAAQVKILSDTGYYYRIREGSLSKAGSTENEYDRFFAHLTRYNSIKDKYPEDEETLLRQLLISARMFILAYEGEKNRSAYTAMASVCREFFSSNRVKYSALKNLSKAEREQARLLGEEGDKALLKIKRAELFRKAEKAISLVKGKN